jgi:hypothetical protein
MVRLYSNSHKWALTASDKAGTAAGTGSFSMTAGEGEVEGESEDQGCKGCSIFILLAISSVKSAIRQHRYVRVLYI